jgi:hypothetical protein
MGAGLTTSGTWTLGWLLTAADEDPGDLMVTASGTMFEVWLRAETDGLMVMASGGRLGDEPPDEFDQSTLLEMSTSKDTLLLISTSSVMPLVSGLSPANRSCGYDMAANSRSSGDQLYLEKRRNTRHDKPSFIFRQKCPFNS